VGALEAQLEAALAALQRRAAGTGVAFDPTVANAPCGDAAATQPDGGGAQVSRATTDRAAASASAEEVARLNAALEEARGRAEALEKRLLAQQQEQQKLPPLALPVKADPYVEVPVTETQAAPGRSSTAAASPPDPALVAHLRSRLQAARLLLASRGAGSAGREDDAGAPLHAVAALTRELWRDVAAVRQRKAGVSF
jgi:hypothetical protein